MTNQNPSVHKVGQFPIIQLMHHTMKTLNLVIKHLHMHKSLVCFFPTPQDNFWPSVNQTNLQTVQSHPLQTQFNSKKQPNY